MMQAVDAFSSRLFFRGQFFPRGWGDIRALAANYALPVEQPGWHDAATIAAFRAAVLRDTTPATIDIAWSREQRMPGTVLRRGTFPSPVNAGLLPDAARIAHVEWIAPAGHDTGMPVCVLFPATGEQGFLSRRLLGLALARRGIASLVLEAPFYGASRPPGQAGARLDHLADLIALMDTTVQEGRALLAWLQRAGYTRLGVSGISMGGSVSALVAARSDFPLACVGLVPAHGVAPVYAQGLLSRYVAWDGLQAGLPRGSDARALLQDWLSAFDVSNFPRPVDQSAACFLSARHDACVPPENAARLHDCWPQARATWIDGAHATAVVTGWNRYRVAIAEAMVAATTPSVR